ncbi:MAG TPA: VOC family protein [Blastocatellia bacterium]|nr:VOC family protein [Blastocatellia bacterium]
MSTLMASMPGEIAVRRRSREHEHSHAQNRFAVIPTPVRLNAVEGRTGKGDARWHRPSENLFLGIDHTAIVVGDTEASLRFYRNALGLKVGGESENHGTEQGHLNNVFGACLRITSLRAEAGPGVEFLEYLSPRDGRPIPSDKRANDLIHWQTKLVTVDAGAAARRLFAAKYHSVSSGVIAMPEDEMAFRKSFLVRDPDGHVLQLIEN